MPRSSGKCWWSSRCEVKLFHDLELWLHPDIVFSRFTVNSWVGFWWIGFALQALFEAVQGHCGSQRERTCPDMTSFYKMSYWAMVLICPWCLSIFIASPRCGFIFKIPCYLAAVWRRVTNVLLLHRLCRDHLKCNLRLCLSGGTCLSSGCVLSHPNSVSNTKDRAAGALQEWWVGLKIASSSISNNNTTKLNVHRVLLLQHYSRL